jgi:TRAP-type C4-dicarboxylate transport system substrate-binding protein
VTLRFGFPVPAASYDNTRGVTPWIQDVEKASGGTLKIQLFTGPALGTFHNIYDRTLTGISQISFSTFGDLISEFPRTDVGSLPFLTRNTTDLSIALWKIYADGLLPEFGKVKLLALFSFPNAVLHTNKPITSLADMKGMRIGVSSRVMGEVMTAFGAAPASLSPDELYEAIQHGLASGAVTSLGAAQVFKLDEVTTYHLEAPLGAAPGFVFMNKDAYAALPQPAKDAIDKFSGASFSKKMGEANDVEQTDERNHLKGLAGQHVSEPSAAEYALWQARVQPIVDAWEKRTPDGTKVLTALRAELDKLASAH